MKIIQQKNLAYEDQPQPMLAREAIETLKPRAPNKVLDPVSVDVDLFLPSRERPKIVVGDSHTGADHIRLTVENFVPGRHVFPPAIARKDVKSLGDRTATHRPLQLEGYVPDHLGFSPMPSQLPKELAIPHFIDALPQAGKRRPQNQATTIFAPDNRFTFNDTRFPWSTTGRVDTPLGFGSGTMIGPRHLLTVSHVVQWNANNTAGWVRFRPSFFDGSAPFGEAWGTVVYSKQKVTGPTIDWIEGMYDYVVVVLDRPMGNLTGWMGSRGYTDSWDGAAYWSHIGYPGDLAAGNRPSFQGAISLDGAWWEFDSHEAMAHRGDVWPGQSGGPFFGWWSGEPWPRAVAVQSSQNSSENNASGGQDMVDLVIQARSDHP